MLACFTAGALALDRVRDWFGIMQFFVYTLVVTCGPAPSRASCTRNVISVSRSYGGELCLRVFRASSRVLEHSVDDRAQALTLPNLLFGKIFDPFSIFGF